ncbi:MAG: RluA family pseudouridine synthase [Clostridia bacterium]|nr:RluA family pseudouridine synthase [Clostridia bacterium]
MKKYTFKVEGIAGAIKIRDFLKRCGFSTSLIAQVKVGGVFINGENVHMHAEVKDDDLVEVLCPKEESSEIGSINIPLDIVYEDENILAVNKPRNMPVHPSRGNSLPTLAECVMAYYGGKFVFRAVNRLDRDTSGLVIIAKDPLTAAIMCREIKCGDLKKKYTALLSRSPDVRIGEINAPIERENEGNMKRVVRELGKPSFTKYKVTKILGDGRAIAEIEPVTGRTHQIRVHMAYIGAPLYNDFLYGKKVADGTYFLHCSELKFTHPTKKVPVLLKAPCPFASFSANN